MSTTVLSIYAMHALSHYFIFLIFEQNILTIITTSIVTQSTTFQLFDLLVYTVWACLKAMTIQKALKEESTNKNYSNDNYSAPNTIY